MAGWDVKWEGEQAGENTTTNHTAQPGTAQHFCTGEEKAPTTPVGVSFI